MGDRSRPYHQSEPHGIKNEVSPDGESRTVFRICESAGRHCSAVFHADRHDVAPDRVIPNGCRNSVRIQPRDRPQDLLRIACSTWASDVCSG